jgi:hypothetical protein
MGATEHVHRVDLNQADPIQHPAEMTDIDPPFRSRLGKALGAQGVTTGLIDGEPAHEAGRLSPIADNGRPQPCHHLWR